MKKMGFKVLNILVIACMLTNIFYGSIVFAENDTVGSASIVYPENETEDITLAEDISKSKLTLEELNNLINESEKFSLLEDYVKKQILDEYLVNEEKMLECEQAGYNVSESIELAKIFQVVDITPEQYEEMVENFGDRDLALKEAKVYANYRYTYSSLKLGADTTCIGYLVNGTKACEILKARSMAFLLNMDIAYTADFVYMDDSGDDIGYIADIFNTKIDVIKSYILNNGLSNDEFIEKVGKEIGRVLQDSDDAISTMMVGGSEGEYDPQSFPLAPFTYSQNGTERINEMTGTVGYCETDAIIEGKNGLNLNIGVYYDSGNSSNAIITTATVGIGVSYTNNHTYYREMYSPLSHFSPGWSFTSSYIMYYHNSFENTYPAYVSENGSSITMKLKDVQDSEKEEIRLYDGRIDIYDVRLYKDSSYEDNGVISMFCAKHKDGKKEYFDAQGKLMKTENLYGDKITYKYSVTGTEIDAYSNHYNKVEITDTLNQVTTIEKKAVTIEYDAEGNEKQIQPMTVTLPDASVITYNLRGSHHPNSDYQYLVQLVESKTNQEGMTTKFEYIEDDESIFSFYNTWDEDKPSRPFYPMIAIIHPTGIRTEYTYEHFRGEMGDVSNGFDHYRILERKETDGINEFNKVTYSYYGDYTWNGTDIISVYATDSNGLITEKNFKYYGKYSYDVYRLKDSERVYYMDGDNEVNISKTEYKNYYERIYPTEITKYVYNTDGTQYLSTVEKYEYDEYGNCTKYWSPYANGNTKNTEYLTTNTYDSEYHYLIETSYKKDADTTIKEVNVPSEDHKNIIQKCTYINDELVAKTDYSYAENSAFPSSQTLHRSTNSGDSVTTTYVYQNNAFKIREITNGNTISYTYDIYGNVLTHRDSNGNLTSYSYDKLNRLIKTKYPDNTEINTEYRLENNSSGVINRVTTTAQNGAKTEYNYDLIGRISNVKDLTLDVVKAAYEFDSNGRLNKTTLSDGAYSTYDYDIIGRKTKQTVYDVNNTLTYQESYIFEDAYDENTSKVTTITGTNDNMIKFAEYTDKYGNKVREDIGDTGKLTESKLYAYDYIGDIKSELFKTEEDGESKVRYSYSLAPVENQGTETVQTDYYGNEVKTIKNMMGQEEELVDGNGNHTYFTYNANGLLSTKAVAIDETPSIIKYYYDGNGNLLQEQITNNQVGAEQTFRKSYTEYDSMNRPVYVWGDEKGLTEYSYDELGNIKTMATGISSEDSDGKITTYEYDSIGRLSQITDPMGYVEQYSYDSRNNITQSVDKNGNIIYNTYDALGRVITNNVTDGSESDMITYSYLHNGLLSSITNNIGDISYNYDVKGQKTNEVATGDTVVMKFFGYDVDGNLSSIMISNRGFVYNQSYEYNHIGQLVAVKDNKPAQIQTTSFTYDNAGNLSTKTLPNGITTEYTYNSVNAIESVTNKKANSVLSSYEYTYYLDGNIAEVTENNGHIQRYTYDGLGRLKTETDIKNNISNVTSYGYDGNGNRISMNVNGTEQYSTSYSYDNNNRLIKESCNKGSDISEKDYYYDKNGNLITKTASSYTNDNGISEMLSLKQYPYTPTAGNGSGTDGTVEMIPIPGAGDDEDIEDVEDVEEVDDIFKTESAIVTDYGYTLRNKLSSIETDNGLAVQYKYDATGTRAKKTINGSSTSYIWNGTDLVYESGENGDIYYGYGHGVIQMANTDGEYYYVKNGHGDVTMLTDSMGTAKENYEYDAFGNQADYGTMYNPFRYSGEYYDKETGLIYLRNRYYDPSMGRFITEDPIKDGLNWYVYCGNNPVNRWDPTGLQWTLLREVAEELGAQVTWDNEKKMACVDFGYYGGYRWYTADIRDDDGAAGIINESTGNYVMLIEEGRIESDFNITDSESHWDEEKDTKIVATLFLQNEQYYQRLSMNGATATWEEVGYKDFNKWWGGRYKISSSQVYGSYLNRENKTWLMDIINFVDAYPSNIKFDDIMTLASLFFEVFGEYPDVKLQKDDYQVIFRDRVYFFNSSLEYKYSGKE